MTSFQFYCLSAIGLGTLCLNQSDVSASMTNDAADAPLVILTDSPQDPWDPAFEPRHELYKKKLAAFMKATGLAYEIRRVSWSRAISSAQIDDNVLFYALMRVPSREENFHWILPLAKSDFYLVGRPGKVKDDLGPSDFASGKFSVICEAFSIECDLASELGFPSSRILKPFGSDLRDRFALVLIGRVDFAVVQDPHMADDDGFLSVSDRKLEAVLPLKSRLSNYLAAGRNLKEDYLEVLTATSREFLPIH